MNFSCLTSLFLLFSLYLPSIIITKSPQVLKILRIETAAEYLLVKSVLGH